MYYPGVQQTSGQSFSQIGQGINKNVAAFQDWQNQQKLLQYYSNLAQWQGANPQGLQAAGPVGQGVGSGDDYTAALVGAPRPGMPASTQQYVSNAGMNALLNNALGGAGVGGAGGVGGGKGKWALLASL